MTLGMNIPTVLAATGDSGAAFIAAAIAVGAAAIGAAIPVA